MKTVGRAVIAANPRKFIGTSRAPPQVYGDPEGPTSRGAGPGSAFREPEYKIKSVPAALGVVIAPSPEVIYLDLQPASQIHAGKRDSSSTMATAGAVERGLHKR